MTINNLELGWKNRVFDKFLMLGLAILACIISGSMFLTERAYAADLSAFDPGYIISDWQMGNYNSMTEADIQNFLKSKGNCNDHNLTKAWNNVDSVSEVGPISWHVQDGHFVCLADETFNGGTAAHLIWQTAQNYRINPQVLIVLLQKEQGLITDSWPNSIQYRSATGYGCPDTAACSEKYYGFKNQLENAAALFRSVLDGGWSNYPVGERYVRYNPNAACGGSVINIKNRATSALYRYTPYQPNAGALAAGYGTAECGAYGNRNFYLYFEDWFGGVKEESVILPISTVLSEINQVGKETTNLDFKYSAHVQNYGWLTEQDGGTAIGTTGYSLRMEAIQLTLLGRTGIEYRAHIENRGWEDMYKKDGEISGTVGDGLRMEAVQIRLTGELATDYDIYYRAHVEGKGWMDWVKNDAIAGTTGQSLRMEALQVKIVKKKTALTYTSHVESYGWMNDVEEGRTSGTVGEGLRVEAIKMQLNNEIKGSIYYRVHVQDIGWMSWMKDGEMAGTTGESRRVEAIEVKLDRATARKYDVYYRVHVQDIGWMDWAKNGEMAGTTGESRRVEAIEVKLISH